MARRAGAGPQRAGRPVWLEIRGQQRLQRLQVRLQLRRQRLQRWSTLVDNLEQEVLDRLEDLGESGTGYDTAVRDVSGRFRPRRRAGTDDGSDDGDDGDDGSNDGGPQVQDRDRRGEARSARPVTARRSGSRTRSGGRRR